MRIFLETTIVVLVGLFCVAVALLITTSSKALFE